MTRGTTATATMVKTTTMMMTEHEKGDDRGQGGGRPEVVQGEIQIAPLSRGEVSLPPRITDRDRRLFGSQSQVAVAPGGRVYGVARPRQKPPVAAWIEGGKLRSIDDTPLPGSSDVYLAAREDGGAALIGVDFHSVWEVDFAERTAQRLFRHEESLYDLAYGPDGRIVLLVSDMLLVYRRHGDGAALEQRLSMSGYKMATSRGGRLLAVCSNEGEEDGVTLLGWSGSTLRRLARVRCSVSELFSVDGRVLLENDEGDLHELLGLDALLDRLAAQPERFPELAVATVQEEDEEDDRPRVGAGHDEDEEDEDREEEDQDTEEEDLDDEDDEDEDGDEDDEADEDEGDKDDEAEVGDDDEFDDEDDEDDEGDDEDDDDDD